MLLLLLSERISSGLWSKERGWQDHSGNNPRPRIEALFQPQQRSQTWVSFQPFCDSVSDRAIVVELNNCARSQYLSKRFKYTYIKSKHLLLSIR